MMAEIEAALRAQNKHVIIAVGHSDAAVEQDSVEFLLSRGCDALILDVEAVSDDYLVKLSQRSVPIVLINRYIQAMEPCCIYLNNELGGYLATRHMVDLGHRSIAYISGPKNKHDAMERLVGHQRALTPGYISKAIIKKRAAKPACWRCYKPASHSVPSFAPMIRWHPVLLPFVCNVVW
jgi:LacI family transcriptional regulator